jgi:tetratricopeptide (TPR) repeat protein
VTPVPAVPLLPRLPGETDAALYARSQEIHDRYERAREMLSGGEYQKAVILLSAIVKQQPQYEQAAGLLGEARQGVRKLASQAATAGERLEQAGDQPGALREYERAQQIDPSWREAEDTVRRLRSAMTAEGSELYSRARQLDAVGLKTDAIALYERALKLLPPDDERSRQATERLRVLKGRLEAPSPGVSSTTGPRRNGSLISRAR